MNKMSNKNKVSALKYGTVRKFEPKPDTVYIKIAPDNHSLSVEEQILFRTITEGVFGYNEQERNSKLKLLSNDCNIRQLLPYFSSFIKDTVHKNIAYPDLTLLIYAVRMAKSLFNNPHVNLAPILHELLPALISCVVAKRISKYYQDNHWTLRDFSVSIIATISDKYDNPINNIKNKIIEIYLKPLKNHQNYPLTTIYGAIKGLGSLGDDVITKFLIPRIYFIGKLLLPNPVRCRESDINQHVLEAKHVRDAILTVVSPILLKNNE